MILMLEAKQVKKNDNEGKQIMMTVFKLIVEVRLIGLCVKSDI